MVALPRIREPNASFRAALQRAVELEDELSGDRDALTQRLKARVGHLGIGTTRVADHLIEIAALALCGLARLEDLAAPAPAADARLRALADAARKNGA
jgi:hypothetical protein